MQDGDPHAVTTMSLNQPPQGATPGFKQKLQNLVVMWHMRGACQKPETRRKSENHFITVWTNCRKAPSKVRLRQTLYVKQHRAQGHNQSLLWTLLNPRESTCYCMPDDHVEAHTMKSTLKPMHHLHNLSEN
jgi:hypothetical protein